MCERCLNFQVGSTGINPVKYLLTMKIVLEKDFHEPVLILLFASSSSEPDTSCWGHRSHLRRSFTP